jgi:hypothetical protein
VLLALATLVLVPGLLAVRAPWTAVPALSLAFWALSAWWPPLSSFSRGRVSLVALLVFALLLLLRFLPKHEVPAPQGAPARLQPAPSPRPGLAPPSLLTPESALVLAAALALALPLRPWSNAPGPEGAFETTAARVVLWRDGIPATLEPLLPLAPFGAHAPALATLAADLARLAGGDPAPAVAVVVAAAAGGLVVGLFALLAVRLEPRAAALSALFGLAAAPWPQWLLPWGEPNAVLALAFLLPGVALVVGHASRSSAVGAGFLLAAGALAQPALALLALAPALAVLARRRSRRGALLRRLALVVVSAIAFGLPGLWPLAQALSRGELASILRAVRPGEAAWTTAGLLTLALAPLVAVPLARTGRRKAGAAGLLAAAVVVVRVHAWMAAGQLSAADEAALRRAAARTPLLEALCASEALRDWVPAVAARPVGEPGPWVPAVYRDEWVSRPRRTCVPFPR